MLFMLTFKLYKHTHFHAYSSRAHDLYAYCSYQQNICIYCDERFLLIFLKHSAYRHRHFFLFIVMLNSRAPVLFMFISLVYMLFILTANDTLKLINIYTYLSCILLIYPCSSCILLRAHMVSFLHLMSLFHLLIAHKAP